MMTVGSLFAGIGGIDLGLERAGMRTLWQVEIDATARRVLSRHWPDVERHADVRAVGRDSLALVDVIVGGFPCQDLSTAGQRRGFGGTRSVLYYEMTRIVDELRPPYFLWENVPGLLSSRGRHDFAAVLAEMDRIGYMGGWRVLDARHFGLAQRRRRVFGCFARRDIGALSAAEILALGASMRGHPAPRREAGQDVAGTPGGGTPSGGPKPDTDAMTLIPAIANALQERDAKGTDSDTKPGRLIPTFAFNSTQIMRPTDRSIVGPGRPVPTLTQTGLMSVANSVGVRRLTPTECERLQGFPDGWTAAGGDGRLIADSARYRMLGNAVAVPVAEWIGRRMVAHG